MNKKYRLETRDQFNGGQSFKNNFIISKETATKQANNKAYLIV